MVCVGGEEGAENVLKSLFVHMQSNKREEEVRGCINCVLWLVVAKYIPQVMVIAI